MPDSIRVLLDDVGRVLDGFIGPGHVGMVSGTHPYLFIARHLGNPIVVAGFGPTVFRQSVRMVLTQSAKGQAKVENQFARVVPGHRNPASLAAISDLYERRPSFEWQGLGEIDASGLKIGTKYAAFDTAEKFGMGCTPDMPMGAFIVFYEGARAADWLTAGARLSNPVAASSPITPRARHSATSMSPWPMASAGGLCAT